MASFTTKVGVTYGTFVIANYLSNFILFPDKKLDYGFLNRIIGREVNNEWCALSLSSSPFFFSPLVPVPSSHPSLFSFYIHPHSEFLNGQVDGVFISSPLPSSSPLRYFSPISWAHMDLVPSLVSFHYSVITSCTSHLLLPPLLIADKRTLK